MDGFNYLESECLMRFGTMLSDIFQSLLKTPATQKYPFERKETPPRLRGKLTWDPDRCSACSLCVKECPSNAIEVITVDRANRRYVMRFQVDRCTFCAQCAQNCRFKCIQLSSEDWELAALNKKSFTQYFGKETDVNTVLAELGDPDAELPGAD
jgi:formate hydrogenlyase subunit 6/NADH:ubiquinone oxidoreductase subunit I